MNKNKIDEFKARKEFFIYLLPLMLLTMVYLLLFQYSISFYLLFFTFCLISHQVDKYKKPNKTGYIFLAITLASGAIQFVNRFLLN